MLKFLSSSLIQWPQRFPGPRNEDGFFRFHYSYILAAFWGVISNTAFERPSAQNPSTVFYHAYNKFDIQSDHERAIFNRANSDVQRYQTNPRIPLFDASWILVVTWVNIYPNTYPIVTTVSFFSLI